MGKQTRRRGYPNYKRYLQRCAYCGEDHECSRWDKRTCKSACRQALHDHLRKSDTAPFQIRTKHEAERAKLESEAALFKPSATQKGR